MGKKKDIQRMQVNPHDSPDGEEKNSSSSSSGNRPQQIKTETDQVEEAQKKAKKSDDSSNSPGQSQDDLGSGSRPGSKVKSIHDLPTEMLAKILQDVDTLSLFQSSRLVNRQWSSISTRILTTRLTPVLNFRHMWGNCILLWLSAESKHKMKIKEQDLQGFLTTMKKSACCPHNSFSFKVNDESFLSCKVWTEFLSFFDPSNPNPNLNRRAKMKYLRLRLSKPNSTDLPVFRQKLRELLLNKIPHVETLNLSISFGMRNAPALPAHPEIPTPAPAPAQFQLPFQLAHLELLRIDQHSFLYFPEILRDILTGAVNLKQIDGQPLDPFFPPGIASTEIFPAVRKLDLETPDLHRVFPQENTIPILPRVETLSILDSQLAKNGISKIAKMCPNLKNLRILKKHPTAFNFLLVVREIWTHMKQLESLEVDYQWDSKKHAFPALDSCFTGISKENCRLLDELKKAENGEINYGTFQSNSKAKTKDQLTEREHASILDMKDLKKLVINPNASTKPEDRYNFFSNKLTWISEEYAFKFLPHLKPAEVEEEEKEKPAKIYSTRSAIK